MFTTVKVAGVSLFPKPWEEVFNKIYGENRIEGSGQELLNNPDVRKSFLGG